MLQDEPRKPFAGRPKRRDGEGCVLYLLADQASGILESIGKDVAVATILNSFSCSPRDLTGIFPFKDGIRVERKSQPGEATRLILTVDEVWKVQLCMPGVVIPSTQSELEPPSVTVFYSSEGDRGEFESQDPPRGGAAVMIASVGSCRRGGSGEISHFAYTKEEQRHTGGSKWDPRAGQAAEVHYYESGQVYMKIHYRRGKLGSSDPETPCFESFWENGNVQVAEFGDLERGRHRPATSGPAYAEYFPNGGAALEIYSKMTNAGRGVADRWVCRKPCGAVREADARDLELVRSTGLAMIGGGGGCCKTGYDPTAGFVFRHGQVLDWGEDEGEKPPAAPLSRSTSATKTSPRRQKEKTRREEILF
jgi:hypothetical protein